MDTDSADWASRVQRLEAEVTGLRRGLRHRGLIEQAKGVLAERLGIDVDEAFQHLVRTSQRTNVRVVDVAADIMTTVRPDDESPEPPAEGRRIRPAGQSRSPQLRPSAPAGASMDGLPATLRRSLMRLRSATAAVDDPDEFIGLVHDEAATALAARAVGLHLARAEGGHRLLAARGWSSQVVADWRSVPSVVRTPAAEALRRNEILVLPDPGLAPLTLIGASEHRAVLPVTIGTSSQPSAALELVWSDAVPRDEASLAYLGGLAAVVAGWLGSTKHPDSSGDPGDPADLDPEAWIAAVVDAAPIPACAVSPLWDGSGRIVDLVVEHLNPAARALWGSREPTGRRLLDLQPALVGSGALAAYAEAYGGEGRPLAVPGPAGPATATRVGRWLLLAWAEADPRAAADRLAAVERLGGFGWGEWSTDGDPLVMSTGLTHLLERDAAVPLNRLLRLVVPEDRPELESALRRAREGQQASAQVGVPTPASGLRVLSVVAAPGPSEQPRTLVLVFQDVTEARRRNADATRAAQRIAAQRMQTAVDRAHTEELRAALFPPPYWGRVHGGWRVAARHTASTSINRFRGDFYEVMVVGGATVIVIGDVFGSGVKAANAMVRLRHAARALTLAGHGPARTLHLMNQELASDADPPLASAVVARLDPGEVAWAQAGHYSPVLLHEGRGRSLRRPRGDALGLIGDTRYTESVVRLAAGDGLVMFTDGVLNRDGGVTTVRRLIADLAEAGSAGGADEVVRRFPRASEDEACVVAADWSR